jgi:diguanylate cyclase (GGDEF)-like protein/PAS domain S-box-containing protein
MHRLLRRQLKKAGFDEQDKTFDPRHFEHFLSLISKTYEDDDASRELLQNSLRVSSAEMRELYHQLQVKNERRLNAIVSAIPDIIFLIDANGLFLDVYAQNKEELLQMPPDAFLGRRIQELFDGTLADLFLGAIEKALRDQSLEHIEYHLPTSETIEYFEARIFPIGLEENETETVAIVVRDITHQKEQEKLFRLSEIVFKEATEGIMIENAERIIIRVNPALVKILGIPEEELLGKDSSYFDTILDAESKENIAQAMTNSGHWCGEIKLSINPQDPMLGWLNIDTVRDEQGNASYFVFMLTDISEIRRSREEMTYLATHDTLTGLPNRSLLFEHLDAAISAMKHLEKKGTLFFIDIDHFKEINDNYGHQAGDLLLKEVALRLQQIGRANDIVGRLSGDEFILIAEDIDNADAILKFLQRLKSLFSAPFHINTVEIELSVSIGVAIFPDDGNTADEVIHAADQAMYTVKKRGRNGYEFYSKEFSLLSSHYFRIETALKRAIRDKRFSIVYQPQFSLTDGSLTGVEALLRCHEEEIAHTPIIELITIAEETGLIGAISHFVLEKNCQQVAQWQRDIDDTLRVAINLSRRELCEPELYNIIHNNLNSCCIKPHMLEFEITESTLIQSNQAARNNIEKLRELGCLFSIDDFGTGYSSLSNLKEFQFDKIKIDKSFIDNLSGDEDDRIIVAATISMAQKLGLTVLAEGVENQAQAQILKNYGCDQVQGYLYGRPVSAEALTDLLVHNRST